MVLGNLKFIAIVVPEMDKAIQQYQSLFNTEILPPQDLPDQGARVAMVALTNTRIQLMAPLNAESPLNTFLKNNPQGGLHHVCYEVENLQSAKEKLIANGIQPLGNGTSQTGYNNTPALFFDPKNSSGVLIELEEAPLTSYQAKERVEVERIGPVHTPHPSSYSSPFKGIDGIGVGVEVDFKVPTPKDNKEDN